VAGTFSQPDPKGPFAGPSEALGSPLDGVLAEKIVMYEQGAVPLPAGYSFEEGACLPCAGVTAWNGLMVAGRSVRPGDTVLILGSGGVSIWGLLFARAAGCRVIATSSSDEKLERLKAMGVSDGVNYRTRPDWDAEVLRLTGGRGVDAVLEVGGTGTLARSFQSLARGGKVALIGVLSHSSETNPHTLMVKGGSLHGIFVGDRQMFEQMNAAIEVNRLKPVIDKVFSFEEAREAYEFHRSGAFIGKVVIGVGPR
jgi:NADPH:quinone reductase-like Zn-dependent oxidoreductase